MQSHSLNLVSIPPGAKFQRLQTPPGEAIHTGGLYLSPDNEVWKPLDVLPFQNAPCRTVSHELEALTAMEGHLGFIKNWRLEEANGRQWLVRPHCLVVGQTFPVEALTTEMTLCIEMAVRHLNAHHWAIHDHLTVAIDPSGEPFVLDLSNAHRETRPDEAHQVFQWLRECGFAETADFRQRAKSVLSHWWLLDNVRPPSIEAHVYAVWNRDEVVDDLRWLGQLVEHKEGDWFVSTCQLPTDICSEHCLEWAYSSICYLPEVSTGGNGS